jgi:pimeloyl-ACP methyl ester carboxylesterase
MQQAPVMPELSIRNQSIVYRVRGRGEPVVLLHGGGSSSRQWKGLTSGLETDFVCYAPDFFGHGASSSWTSENGPLLADYAAIVEAIAALIGGPFHLVGHSHGGAVAATYAIAYPSSLASLTLIEPTLMHLLRVSQSPAWREAEELGTKHIDAVSRGELSQIADEFLPYWIGREPWHSMPNDRRTAIINTMPAVAQFWASEFSETTPVKAYKQLTVPTLLVRGTRTRVTAWEIISLLHGSLPNSRLVDIEGAGHMAPLTHAADVNKVIVQHLAKYRSAVAQQ